MWICHKKLNFRFLTAFFFQKKNSWGKKKVKDEYPPGSGAANKVDPSRASKTVGQPEGGGGNKTTLVDKTVEHLERNTSSRVLQPRQIIVSSSPLLEKKNDCRLEKKKKRLQIEKQTHFI
jgi:hypothetical protein